MRLPQEIQLTLADMITGGVFERFPRLKIVSAENDGRGCRILCIGSIMPMIGYDISKD